MNNIDKKTWSKPVIAAIGNERIKSGVYYFAAGEVYISCSYDLDTTGPNAGSCNYVAGSPVASFGGGSNFPDPGPTSCPAPTINNSSAFACS